MVDERVIDFLVVVFVNVESCVKWKCFVDTAFVVQLHVDFGFIVGQIKRMLACSSTNAMRKGAKMGIKGGNFVKLPDPKRLCMF
jgi:hypothetical protein